MSTGYLFSGQGAQRVGMGKDLYEASPRARELYDEADAALGWSLKQVSFAGPLEELTLTRVCQPALYVHGYVVFTLLQDLGKAPAPTAAAGLSLGELTALAVAGAFSFTEGLRIVAERGARMQEACEATDGTMASILGGTRQQVGELCGEFNVDMANLNCPGQIVISGERSKVEAAVAAAQERGTFKRVIPLTVAGAYHSRLMEPARVAFGKFLCNADIESPRIPVYSNATGGAVRTPDEIRDALTAQVVSPVKWEDDIAAARHAGVLDFIECGPGKVLAGLVKRIDRGAPVTSVETWEELQAFGA